MEVVRRCCALPNSSRISVQAPISRNAYGQVVRHYQVAVAANRSIMLGSRYPVSGSSIGNLVDNNCAILLVFRVYLFFYFLKKFNAVIFYLFQLFAAKNHGLGL